MKIVFISPVSVSVMLENDSIYYSPKEYDVYLNEKKVLSNYKKNVFSLYELTPNTQYELKVDDEVISFKTDAVSEVVDIYPVDGVATKYIQEAFDNAKENALIVIHEGSYNVSNLFLRSNKVVYLKEGATLNGSTNPDDYLELQGEDNRNGEIIQRGTWEGDPWNMKYALINVIDGENVKLVGQGKLDMHAADGPWFIDFRKKPYARPHTVFINQSNKVYLEGIKLYNATCWTVHPYFSTNVGFYDLYIENDPYSPNTDGINPQCVNGCEIIGVEFSVGDDCIAIKSGKLYLGKKYKRPSENILVSNCYMNRGHGAIVLGSEMAGGLKNLTISNCLFDHTDRGLRIKSRRGRGKDGIIDNVKFSHIKMDNVLTPFVINMFYFCDPDGKTEYVWSKEALPVDERTPYLGRFIFEDIECINTEYCAGYFYGLPEQHIKEVIIRNAFVSFKEDAGEGTPAMMSFAEKCSKRGFVFNNVDKAIIENVKMVGNEGEFYTSINRDFKIDIK